MKFKVSKIKTPSGVERYQVRGWDGVGDGRLFWKRRFESRQEAQHFADEKLYGERKERQAALMPDKCIVFTMRDVYQSWKLGRYHELAPGWRRNVDQYWKIFEPLIGDTKITEITPNLLRTFESDLRAKGNSRSTVKRKIGWIQTVLNYAVEMELIQFNPTARFRTAKPESVAIEFWEKEEALSFLEFTRGLYPPSSDKHWIYLVYLVAINTGLRSAEIWALRPIDLKKSMGTMQIDRQLDLVDRSFRVLKGKVGHPVPMPKEISDELESWIKLQSIKPTELIFKSNGAAIDHNNFAKRIFKADLNKWAGKPITFHGLRHTAATLMLSAGVDVTVVQRIFGHKKIETTMRYVHAVGDSIKKAGDIYCIIPKTSPIERVVRHLQLLKQS